MMAIMFCDRLFPSSERNRKREQYSTAIAINFYHTPVRKKSVRLLL
ncbi:MAG: hypothetical protein V7K50_24365 [Nostoc sp.]